MMNPFEASLWVLVKKIKKKVKKACERKKSFLYCQCKREKR